jgi:hypothetical protein
MKNWHDVYEKELSETDRNTVDIAFREAVRMIKDRGRKISNDDRAEKLIAAITEFMFESER